MRSRRATRSADGSGSTDGAQVSTVGPAAQHQRHRGVERDALARRRRPSARPSQPVASSYGRVPPLSSTCWASKCERSRYGRPTAWTTASLAAPIHRVQLRRAAGGARTVASSAQRRRRELAERAAGAARSRVAGRRHGRQPVHAAAQDDEHEAVAARLAGRREARRRPRRERAGAEQRADDEARGADRSMASSRVLSRAARIGLRSAALEFGRHQQQGERLRAVGGAFDLRARSARAEQRAEAAARRGARASTARPTRSAMRVAHSTRFHTASGPSQSSARSLQPAGDGAREQALAERADADAASPGRSNMRSPSAEQARRSRRRIPPASSAWPCVGAQRLGLRDQRAVDRRQVAVAAAGRPRPAARPAPAAARRRRSGAPAWWRRSARSPGGRARSCSTAPQRLGPFGVDACRARSSGPARASAGSNGDRRRRRASWPTRQPVSTAANAVTSACV